ncbi:MAG: DUF262 domain-containing protein [Bacteroidetes bacterium]|nr:DUF262 domain-containing protein [Bacteroidota bacterium]
MTIIQNNHEEMTNKSQDLEVEGLDDQNGTWGNYPLDDFLIRSETRTVHSIMRRIDQSYYIMKPDFQRDFIWDEGKQSKLIESVIMRIPLPVFYLAENELGKMIVVDGLQRLSTFHRFFKDQLKLKLPDREDINGKTFSELLPKFQNRIEDCNLILYTIDSKIPESARLDIFERVNAGIPLSRQQMRNCIYMGKATKFLHDEANSDPFKIATGKSLDTKTMRDREFVNRFCAFQIIGYENYQGNMDDFLADVLRKMNDMDTEKLEKLSNQFQTGLNNNFLLFGQNAFRKHEKEQERRGVLNASLWDAMCTGLSNVDESIVHACSGDLKREFYALLKDEDFYNSISTSTNSTKQVKTRFSMVNNQIIPITHGYAS